MRFVLDILSQDIEAVYFGGQSRRNCRAGLVTPLGHFTRRARGVGGNNRLDPQFADVVAALAQRHDMAFDRLEIP
jgi:hypothetical protein